MIFANSEGVSSVYEMGSNIRGLRINNLRPKEVTFNYIDLTKLLRYSPESIKDYLENLLFTLT